MKKTVTYDSMSYPQPKYFKKIKNTFLQKKIYFFHNFCNKKTARPFAEWHLVGGMSEPVRVQEYSPEDVSEKSRELARD